MNYGLRLGATLAEGEHMRHNIMANLVLVRGGSGIVNVVYVRAHFGDLLLGYGNAKLALALRKGNPKPSPCRELAVIGKNAFHLLAGVAGTKWVDIKFMIGHIKKPRKII